MLKNRKIVELPRIVLNSGNQNNSWDSLQIVAISAGILGIDWNNSWDDPFSQGSRVDENDPWQQLPKGGPVVD